jgi:ActR/RegA family two-component response regulator
VTVKLDNESAFIDEATELASNPKKLDEIRANAFESIANLDWDRIHEAFEMILRNVIASTLMLSKKDIPITKFIHEEANL